MIKKRNYVSQSHKPYFITEVNIHPPPAVLYDDLHSFDPTAMVWRLLSPAAGSMQPKSARFMHGFTSLAGKLYMHGGTILQDTGQGKTAICGLCLFLKFYLYTPPVVLTFDFTSSRPMFVLSQLLLTEDSTIQRFNALIPPSQLGSLLPRPAGMSPVE